MNLWYLTWTLGLYFSINSVGSRIWSLLDRARTEEELLADITQKYPVSRDTARRDIQELIEDLVRHGLLEVIDENRPST